MTDASLIKDFDASGHPHAVPLFRCDPLCRAQQGSQGHDYRYHHPHLDRGSHFTLCIGGGDARVIPGCSHSISFTLGTITIYLSKCSVVTHYIWCRRAPSTRVRAPSPPAPFQLPGFTMSGPRGASLVAFGVWCTAFRNGRFLFFASFAAGLQGFILEL